MPNWAYTYITNPEQSNPAGVAPPYTYGTPWYCIAVLNTADRLKGGCAALAASSEADGPVYDAAYEIISASTSCRRDSASAAAIAAAAAASAAALAAALAASSSFVVAVNPSRATVTVAALPCTLRFWAPLSVKRVAPVVAKVGAVDPGANA
jgi:hypothetical protein